MKLFNKDGQEVKLIKVWCEYDFNGDFGGNNNEDVVPMLVDTSTKEIGKELLQMLLVETGLDKEEDLEDLWGWEVL